MEVLKATNSLLSYKQKCWSACKWEDFSWFQDTFWFGCGFLSRWCCRTIWIMFPIRYMMACKIKNCLWLDVTQCYVQYLPSSSSSSSSSSSFLCEWRRNNRIRGKWWTDSINGGENKIKILSRSPDCKIGVPKIKFLLSAILFFLLNIKPLLSVSSIGSAYCMML